MKVKVDNKQSVEVLAETLDDALDGFDVEYMKVNRVTRSLFMFFPCFSHDLLFFHFSTT